MSSHVWKKKRAQTSCRVGIRADIYFAAASMIGNASIATTMSPIPNNGRCVVRGIVIVFGTCHSILNQPIRTSAQPLCGFAGMPRALRISSTRLAI